MNKTGVWKFMALGNIPWYKFCFWSVSKDFTKDEMCETPLNCTVYDFSVDHSCQVDRIMIYELLNYELWI